MAIYITKASGERVPFDPNKLSRSLHQAGASNSIIEEILKKVKQDLYDGISTHQIYKTAFQYLKKASWTSAAKYKLKEAIMALGPSGYPFEKYVAEILAFQGYVSETGQYIKGHCVTHEVDVLAHKGKEYNVVECKFHNRQGYKCDVKVPLYLHSRFRDIEREWRKNGKEKDFSYKGWIVTNTHFSDDALQYGKCSNINMVGWDYPFRGSLKERIDIAGLHPVTALTNLTRKEENKLLQEGIVLCRDLKEEALDRFRMSDKRKRNVLEESEILCHPQQQEGME